MSLRERLAKSKVDEQELADIIWPYIAKETYAAIADHEQELRRLQKHIEQKIACLTTVRAQAKLKLLTAAITGLSSGWTYNDRVGPSSAQALVDQAMRIVNAAMKKLEEP